MASTRTRARTGLALLVGALLAPAMLATFLDSPFGQPAGAKGDYVCPPCARPCDELEHEAAGTCSSCGMPLVTKAEARRLAEVSRAREASRRRALVLVFPGVQIIDFTGPYEVLGQAGLEVAAVAEKAGPLQAAMGLTITPRYTLADAPEAHVIVVPGGDVGSAEDSEAVRRWLRERSAKAEVVLSVCNGAFILARAGLLDGLSATTFAGLIDGLRAAAPKTRVVDDRRFVDNGRIVTSAGLSSGMDGALHVVEKLYGRGAAQRVATNLEYDWNPKGTYVRAQLADRHLREVYRRIGTYERELLLHEGTRDRWESRWRVTTESPAPELLAALVPETAAAATEEPTPRSPGGAGGGAPPPDTAAGEPKAAKVAWTFRSADGSSWKGTASAELEKGPGRRYALTVRIERG